MHSALTKLLFPVYERKINGLGLELWPISQYFLGEMLSTVPSYLKLKKILLIFGLPNAQKENMYNKFYDLMMLCLRIGFKILIHLNLYFEYLNLKIKSFI